MLFIDFPIIVKTTVYQDKMSLRIERQHRMGAKNIENGPPAWLRISVLLLIGHMAMAVCLSSL